MKKMRIFLPIILILCMLFPMVVHAREGDCGYEGGISSGEAPNKKTFEYQEVCFITGEPIVFKGTLTLKKSLKQNAIVATYTYNLKNVDRTATLTRTLIYNTTLTKKDNGQTIEETVLSGTPSESIKIGNTTYSLQSYDLSRTSIVDARPAINYYAGNLWGKKIFRTGQNGAAGGGTITVEATGEFYGYDQYWGTTEVQTIDYVIQSEQKKGQTSDKWGGTARTSVSSTTTKQMKYVQNEPTQISFDGGYVQTQYNNSIMEYSAELPEFDSKGASTDRLLDVNDSLKLETFPVQTRLRVPNISKLRGHWAENDIKSLFSLEVFKGNEDSFNPEQYMTRAEFATAMLEAAKEVPPDPALVSKVTTPSKTTNKTVESSFSDVSATNPYFTQIETSYKRGLITGKGYNTFSPDNYLIVADAVTIFVRALGLEGLAPNPAPVTAFRDNDQIPNYARSAAYVAAKIGLTKGDEKGNLNPKEYLTKARAAALINRFINYMRDGIRKDYRDRIVNY